MPLPRVTLRQRAFRGVHKSNSDFRNEQFTVFFGNKCGGSHWKRMKENEGGANLPSFLSVKNYSKFIPKDLESVLYRSSILKNTHPPLSSSRSYTAIAAGRS